MIAILLGFQALSMTGCNQAAKRDVDSKLASEPAPANRDALRAETSTLIESANITAEQKAKLTEIRDQTRAQLDDDQKSSLKLRSALMEEVMAENFNQDQVNVIKSRMKKLENHRLATLFKAVDQANKVLGHDRTELRREYMRDIIKDPSEISRASAF